MVKYRFVSWTDETGAVIGTTPSISLMIDRDRTLTANYEAVPTHVLTVNSDPISGVSFTINGTSLTTPYSGSLEEGSYTVTMPSSVTSGTTTYNFDHWEDGSTSPTRTISLTADMTLTAYYVAAPVEYALTINTTAGGTTDPAPGTYRHPSGASVTVTAIPDVGYVFDHWVLDGVTRTENPITVLMDSDHALTAYFATAPPVEYTLTIATTVGGTTDPAPGSYVYPEGSSVSVTAIPDMGYEFDHWILDGATRTENPLTITMDRDYTLTAYFRAIPVEYSLTISATAGGTTDPAPGSYTYPSGTSVSVTAIPSSGYIFDHWELDGVDVGTVNPITVTMDADHTLNAVFTTIPPAQGALECHAYADSEEVSASVEVVGVGTYTTPFTLTLDVGDYTLNAAYNTQTQTKTAHITEGETARVDFTFTKAPPLTGPLEIWTFPLVSFIGTMFPTVRTRAETILTEIKKRWGRSGRA